MLRRNPTKILRTIGFFPKPLTFVPRCSFSENDNKNSEEAKKKQNRFSIGQYITKLNTFLENKENSMLKWVSSINYQNMHFSNRKIVLLVLGLLIVGYNLKTMLFYVQDISYNVISFILSDFKQALYKDLFQSYVVQDLIEKIRIKKILDSYGYYYKADVILKSGDQKRIEIGNIDYFLDNLEKLQQENNVPVNRLIPIEFQHRRTWVAWFEHYYNFIYGAVSLMVILGFIRNLSRNPNLTNQGGNNIFGIGKSNAKVFGVENQIKTRFADVAGLDEAKVEITEFVDFLKRPKKYKELGARLPRGALLSGPPGTGKTMLAKACAGEAKVPFFYLSGSDFVEMFVGVGAARVRDLFKQAKEKSPSIIFIDEIDAVGRKRENKMGGNDERDNTLNQLLVEMDGFGTDTNIVVLAATNKKELLDSALTRPGRFDRNIEVTLPDLDGRRQIFNVHLKKIKLDPSNTMDEFARRLATLTPGFSGADIANLCNEAAILAARGNKPHVETIDFEMASERVLAGLEKRNLLTDEEKKKVAIHESGHAVVSWFLEGGAPLLKITIIPRSKGSLGYAQYLPNESSLENKEDLLDRICYMLGGRVAEEVFFGKISTGAYDDLEKVSDLSYAMVSKLGMNDKIGLRGFKIEDYVKTMSQETLKEVDDEVHEIIKVATKRTREIIIQHRELIEKLSNKLLEKESLDLKGIIEILGERPFPAKKNFKEYLETKHLIETEKKQKAEQATTQA